MNTSLDCLMDDEASGAGAWPEALHGLGNQESLSLPDHGVYVFTGAQKRPFHELCAPLIKVGSAGLRST
jgi:hypothetical protein